MADGHRFACGLRVIGKKQKPIDVPITQTIGFVIVTPSCNSIATIFNVGNRTEVQLSLPLFSRCDSILINRQSKCIHLLFAIFFLVSKIKSLQHPPRCDLTRFYSYCWTHCVNELTMGKYKG